MGYGLRTVGFSRFSLGGVTSFCTGITATRDALPQWRCRRRAAQRGDRTRKGPTTGAAIATRNPWYAFVVGMAASLGAGISMGFAEALSDDGSLTGRGHPLVRGLVCGAMTTVGGVGHTLPFLVPDFRVAFISAFVVVLAELAVITWIRHRYMDTPAVSAAIQVLVGGALVFATGVLIGSS